MRRSGAPEPRITKSANGEAAEPSRKPRAGEVEDNEEERLLDRIFDAVMDFDDEETAALVSIALDRDMDVHVILKEALIAAMDEVGAMFSDGTIFVPEMLLAARAMKTGLKILHPILTRTGAPPRGKVILATVQGDVHDIGKNLVGMMLEGAGYEVVDMGVNVAPQAILESAERLAPDVVGLSALLTTSMPSMRKTVDLFRNESAPYPIIIGGAPVTQDFADSIGAYSYGENAPGAVAKINQMVVAGLRQAGGLKAGGPRAAAGS